MSASWRTEKTLVPNGSKLIDSVSDPRDSMFENRYFYWNNKNYTFLLQLANTHLLYKVDIFLMKEGVVY